MMMGHPEFEKWVIEAGFAESAFLSVADEKFQQLILRDGPEMRRSKPWFALPD
jgi:hypothetical protein